MNAFRKIGIVPFNSHVLTPDQFLSHEITCEQIKVSSSNLEVFKNKSLDSVFTFLRKKVPKSVPPIKRKFPSKNQTSGKEITNLQIADNLVSTRNKTCKVNH